MQTITVIKCNLAGEETWRYTGRALSRSASAITLEAYFNRPDIPFHGILLAEGDRFVETFYSDRWYNVFEMHGRGDDRLKGWYCNIARPAVINAHTVSYIDLALDLLAYPDGRQLVLDEDEFAALSLDAGEQAAARAALADLQKHFNNRILFKGS